jgi:hypothetical protein
MAAAIAGITRNVRNVALSVTISASSNPATPANMPEINHANESMCVTRIPMRLLTCRSFANARIDSPSRVTWSSNAIVPTIATAIPRAARRVYVTRTENIATNRWSVGSVSRRGTVSPQISPIQPSINSANPRVPTARTTRSRAASRGATVRHR